MTTHPNRPRFRALDREPVPFRTVVIRVAVREATGREGE